MDISQYDLNKDGELSPEELAKAKEILKQDSQKKMAWFSLISIVILTIFILTPVLDNEKIKIIGDFIGLFYVSMASIVGAYMGFTAYMSRR